MRWVPGVRRRQMDKSILYDTLLQALASYRQDPLAEDLLRVARSHPGPRLEAAFNRNQMACKLWLIRELRACLGPEPATVWVIGGWYGVLSALLLADPDLPLRRCVSIDLDPRCASIANILNQRHRDSNRFLAVTRDAHGLDYRDGEARLGDPPDVLVNTSCEHFAEFGRWYGALPTGLTLALQSNDYRSCPEHSNCVDDLGAFRAQAPMAELSYGGELKLKRYTRFMLIGRK